MFDVFESVELELQPFRPGFSEVCARIRAQRALNDARQAEVKQVIRVKMRKLSPRNDPRRIATRPQAGRNLFDVW